VETLIFGGLLMGLAWTPFWLGGNRTPAWGIDGVYFPSLVFLYEAHLLLTGASHPVGVKRLAIPAALFALVVIWIFVQLSTLVPAALAHPIWAMAADALGQPIAGAISVNRGATHLALLRLLTAASVFWLSLQLCRHETRAQALLRFLSFVVAAYAAYGLILAALFSSAIPFFDAPDAGGFVRSTFVNRNNFATYAGLGLIVSVALTLELYRPEVSTALGMEANRLGRFIEATGRRSAATLGASFVTLVALLASGSRGAAMAISLALLVLFALAFSRQRSRAEAIEAIVFVAAALFASFAFFGEVFLGRVAASGLEDAKRLSVYRITLNSILDTPLFGYGFGTFADVFPMYRDQSISRLGVWEKAHDDYLEIFQGLGLVFGSALLAALSLIALKSFSGAIRRRRETTSGAVAAAASLLVGVHALVDFSMQIEAVALTYMAILGLGAAQAESSRRRVSD